MSAQPARASQNLPRRALALAAIAGLIALGMPRGARAQEVIAQEKIGDATVKIVKIAPPEHGVLTKMTDFQGIPIKGTDSVTTTALFEAYKRISFILQHNPQIVANLKTAGAQEQIFGRNEFTSTLPYESYWKTGLYDGISNIDQRTRGISDLYASAGEENLLKLRQDRYFGSDIMSHEFMHTVHHFGLSKNVYDEWEALYNKTVKEQGLWKGMYSATNSTEHIAESIMWYDGMHGSYSGYKGQVPRKDGPEFLKAYDPVDYAFMDKLVNGKLDVKPIVWKELKALPASEEEAMKTKFGDENNYSPIIFDNQTDEEWLCSTYDKKTGKRTVYNAVLPHDKMGADSLVGQGWVVTNLKQDKVRACYVVDDNHVHVTLK